MSTTQLIKQSAEPLTGAHSPQGKQKIKTRKVYPRISSKEHLLEFCASLDYSDIDAVNHAVNGLGKFFNYMGMGSGRLVYNYNAKSVIKFAMNKNGAAQNTKEAHVASRSSLMAKVFDVSPNGNYIITEKITPFNDGYEFNEKTGLSENLLDALRDRGLKGESQFFRLTPKDLTPKDLELLQDENFMHKLGISPLSRYSAELLSEMLNVARYNNLATADLFKHDSWGTDAKGNLKCLDYGFGIGAAQFGMRTGVYFEGGIPSTVQEPDPFVDSPYVENKHRLREEFFRSLPKYEAIYNICNKFYKTAKIIQITEFDSTIIDMIKAITDEMIKLINENYNTYQNLEKIMKETNQKYQIGDFNAKINNENVSISLNLVVTENNGSMHPISKKSYVIYLSVARVIQAINRSNPTWIRSTLSHELTHVKDNFLHNLFITDDYLASRILQSYNHFTKLKLRGKNLIFAIWESLEDIWDARGKAEPIRKIVHAVKEIERKNKPNSGTHTNLKTELQAFANQIIDEMRMMGFRSLPGQDINQFLDYSRKWNYVLEDITEQNKKTLLKYIYDGLKARFPNMANINTTSST